jgi:hypothetical protein
MLGNAPTFWVDVECYAGYRGDETPRRFRLGERQIEITAVVDRWLAPDHRYFEVQDARGAVYILRHDIATSHWQLTVSQSRRPVHDHASNSRG